MSKADFWLNHIKQWQQSNLNQTQYCKQHDLVYHNFQYWVKRARKQQTESPSTFIPLSVEPISHHIEIHCHDVRLSVPIQHLAMVLTQLKQAGLSHAQA